MNQTEEERRARKERERAERKAKEAAAAAGTSGEKEERRRETEEERRARKERERAERKAKEAAAAAGTSGEKEERRRETEEERRARKERERAERKAKEAAAAGNVDHSSTTKDSAPATSAANLRLSVKPTNEVSALVAAIEEENREATLRNARQTMKSQDASASVSKVSGEEFGVSDGAGDANNTFAGERTRERRGRKKGREGADQNSSVLTDSVEVDDTSLVMQDLRRQGYRAQFERDLARATVLRRLVDLDDAAVVLFDMAPQSEYDLYIRSFNESGKRQMWVQVPAEEDFIDAEVQVDRAHSKNRALQVPDDLFLHPEQPMEGGDVCNGDANEDKAEIDPTKEGLTEVLAPSVDSDLLGNFIHHVLPIMSAVLDSQSEQGGGAGETEGVNKGGTGTTPLASFSYACTTYCSSLSNKRLVQKVHFSYAPSHYVAALYGVTQEETYLTELDRYPSVILVWSIFDNSEPERVLVSYSSLSCICFSPSRPELVYGGSEDGSVCVWDLREPDHHHLYEGRHQRLVFRLPSYSSSWHTEQHRAPVRQLCVPGYNSVFGPKRDGGEQLASLDSSGEVKFWAVSDKDTRSRTNINQNEHGMHIFSTVKLSLVGSSLRGDYSEVDSVPNSPPPGLSSSLLAYSGCGWGASALDFTPTDASRYIVATPRGVMHCSRYGGITVPSLYGPASQGFSQPTAVPCCVQCNVLDSRFIEVGYEDGTVRLFLNDQKTPQLTVVVASAGVPIIGVCCSNTVRWVALALDQTSTLHVLDHAHKNREGPQFSFPLAQPDTGACLCMNTPAEMRSSEKQVLALGFERGMIQVHSINTANLQAPALERNESWL